MIVKQNELRNTSLYDRQARLLEELALATRCQWDESLLTYQQQSKLKSLLLHARTVPYYRRVFEALKFNRKKWTSNDLSRLPILTKDILRNEFDQLVSSNASLENCWLNRTSGSTGEPTLNYHEPVVWEAFDVCAMRMQDSIGISDCQRIVRLIPRYFAHSQDILRSFFVDTNGWHWAWEIHEDRSVDEIIDAINQIGPSVLYGNPFLMRGVAARLKQRNEHLDIGHVISSFESLDPASRQMFEHAFGTEALIDVYGFSEIGDVAWECLAGRGQHYHVNADYLIVEVVDPDTNLPCAPNEVGHIVVTSLFHRAMPLIRYSPGDLGVLSDNYCECGRKLPLLSQVVGRTVDFVVAKNGAHLSPYEFFGILIDQAVGRFTLIQERPGQITVILESLPYTPIDIAAITNRVKEKLGELSDVEIHIVDRLPTGPGRKHLAFRSFLSEQDYHA